MSSSLSTNLSGLQCTFCLAPLYEKKDSHSVERVNCRNIACPLYKVTISRRIIENRLKIIADAAAKPPVNVEDD